MKLSSFSNWREWELNPVVVKEVRQAVRSWAVTGMLLLFLAVLFFTTVGFLVGYSVTSANRQALGRDILMFFIPILTFTSLVFIPLYVAVRLAAERQEHNVDLLYITTLSPARIIRGKLMCGVYLTVLFFSVCMPFLVFTNLLRGVDLPTIFVALAVIFLAVVLAIQLAIFIACLPATKGFKILITLPAVGFALGGGGTLTGVFIFMLQTGTGSRLGTWDFWGPALACILLGGLLVGLLHVASVAMISPASANRALPVRLYMTAAWFIGGVTAVSWTFIKGWTEPVESWVVGTLVLMIISLLLAVCEGDERSVRVARTIPQHPGRQFVAFFFYNGSAGGVAWVTAITFVTLMLAWLSDLTWLFAGVSRGSLGTELTDEFLAATTTVFAYALAYALAGVFIHRRFLPQRAPFTAGLLAMLIPALWAVLPNLALFFMNKLKWEELQERQLGNVFNVFILKNPAELTDHLAFSLCFVLLMTLLNVRWFLAQLRGFKPYVRPEKPAPPPLPS